MEYSNLIRKFHATGISTDSRLIQPGEIFIATPGIKNHGNNFINHAISKGAKAVITDRVLNSRVDIEVLQIDDTSRLIQELVDYFFPLMSSKLVAVTGTNGKTSSVHYFQQLCNFTNNKAASIGTLGVIVPKDDDNIFDYYSNSYTTFDYVTLRKILHILSSKGVNYVGLEASSHGLDQGRLDGLKFSATAFTNFTHDHLDYHSTMENYLTAKLKLFSENKLFNNGVVILNSEMNNLSFVKNYIRENSNNQVITIGKNGDVKFSMVNQSLFGQRIHFYYQDTDYYVKIPLIGEFQAMNIIMAVLLANKVGIDIKELVEYLPELNSVPGRLENIGKYNGGYIFVDFAHTPDALEVVLKQLRILLNCEKKLILMFGCGGDRDPQKRPIMGKIAQKLADCVIITDDNPRNENPVKIRQDILQSAPDATEIGDREEAIKYALSQIEDGDILLLAGKGHEDYQIIGNKKFYFSDINLVKKIIS